MKSSTSCAHDVHIMWMSIGCDLSERPQLVLRARSGTAGTAKQTASSAASIARTGLFPGWRRHHWPQDIATEGGPGLKPVLFSAGFTTSAQAWSKGPAGARRWLARTERTSRRSPAARCSCRQLRWHQQALEKAGDRCMKNNKFALHAALGLQPYKMTNRVFPLLYG